MQHRDFMAEALLEARLAGVAGEVPVGAVVVCRGQIIGRGHNRREQDRDPFGHAEMAALAEAANHLARWRLSDCTLYVTLEPCPMCAGGILQARLQRLVFGCWDPKWGAAGSVVNLLRPGLFHHQMEVLGGIEERACQQLLQDFFQKIRG